VYRSQDDGLTWGRVLACGGCRTTAVDPNRPGLVYAGGEAGLWRSRQNGAPNTWEPIGPPDMAGQRGGAFWDVDWEGVASIRPDPNQPGRVYVAVFGQGRGLYRSDDAGQTWAHLLTDAYLWDVAPVPGRPGYLLAASSSARYSGGYDPASQGLRVSADGGQTWKKPDIGLPWPFVTGLWVVSRPNSVLWLASPGTGFYVGPLPP